MSELIKTTNLLSNSFKQNYFRCILVCCFTVGLIISPTILKAQNKGSEKDVTIQNEKSSIERITYKGSVIDEDDQPIPGVSIIVKGKPSLGTTTDLNGEFTLTIPEDKHILVFSCIGMKTQELRITNNKRLTVRLETDAVLLEDAVVTGMYTRKSESFTGSVSTYKGSELKMVGNQNILQSFKTLDPSFIFLENNLQGSNPNATWDVNVRGKTSIVGLKQEYDTDPNQPLFILDGFETTLQTISDLSMDRVESITILKDAASTAIYGSKAANGVIVVETKKPEAGRLQFSYDGSFSVAWADLSDYNLMNSSEKLEFEKLAGYYGDLDQAGEIITETNRKLYYSRLKASKEGLDTYWMNEPLRTAFIQSHTIHADGGDSAFRYGLGFSYRKNEGVMKGSDRNTLNGNVRLSYRIDKFSFINQTSIDYLDLGNEIVSFSEFSSANPFYRKRTNDGEIEKLLDSYYDENRTLQYVYNPLWDFNQNSFNISNTFSVTNNFQTEWNILPELRARGKFGLVTSRTENEIFTSPNATSFASTEQLKRGSYNKSNGQNTSYDGSFDIIYGNVFNKHVINFIAGMQAKQSSNNTASWEANGYITDKFYNPNFSNGYPEGKSPYSKINKSRSASYYANGNYAYDARYLLDVNMRLDGSSVYGVHNPFVGTWSLGLGWNIHNEKFFKKSDIINYLKVRYSIGNPGNQNFNAKLASSIYNYSTTYQNPFGLAAVVSTWGNKDLKWERTLDQNIGMDLTMFKQSFRFTLDYFVKKTDPMQIGLALPASTGAGSAPINIGAKRNEGFTISTSYTILKKKDTNITVTANLRHIKSTYYNIGNILEKYNEEGRENNSLLRFYDGASETAMWAVRSAGIDPMTGNEIFIRKDGTYTFEWNANDEVKVGDSTPKVEGIVGTSAYYEGFSMNISFRYRIGGQILLSTLFDKVENISAGSLRHNHDVRALYDRWQKPGDVAKFKRISSTDKTEISDRFIADENTLSCESISFGYEATKAKWIKAIGASSFNIRLYANDIFRISTVKEERGLNYPFQRSISGSFGFRF